MKLELVNPPEEAFVDGRIIRSLQANLFAVLRDILFVHGQIASAGRFQHLNLENSAHITNLVFSILRNARTLHLDEDPNMVVCWGGHSINENEYLYARKVGSQLGLRELNICTGCGPGAMEAPMKGAAVGHAQQLPQQPLHRHDRAVDHRRRAANPLVNELVIMPDIENAWKPSCVSHTASSSSGRRRHRRRAAVPAGYPDEPGEQRTGAAADPDRAERERRLLPRAGRVHHEHAGRRSTPPLHHHHRRSGGSGAADEASHAAGEGKPPQHRRRLQLQLVDPHRAGSAAAVRADP